MMQTSYFYMKLYSVFWCINYGKT